ncbi:hypothetical protein SAMN05720760_11468, partial [Fibrobacter sp. UWB8]
MRVLSPLKKSPYKTFDWKFEDEKFEEGLKMTIQAEIDYTIASIGL